LEHLLHCERSNGIVIEFSEMESSKVVNFSTMTTPLYFYFGRNDRLVDSTRYQNLTSVFAENVLKEFSLLDFGHADFVWGGNARELIYEKIVHVMSTTG